MTLPSLRKISTKVALSFVLIVLLQGALSIIVLSFTMREAMRASIADQSFKVERLIENYCKDAKDDLLVKGNLLAGQGKIAALLERREIASLRFELSFYMSPLKLDAILIVDNDGNEIVKAGNPSLAEILLRENPKDILVKSFLTTSTAYGTLNVKSEGNRIQLWSLHEITGNGAKRKAIICVARSLDHSFISRVEDLTDTHMLLALRDTILVNGRVEDNIFIEYSRRVAAAPELNANGSIKAFSYGTTHMADYPDLKLVYFIDKSPKRDAADPTKYNALADTLDKNLAFTLIIIAATLLIAAATSVFLYRYSFKKPFAAFQDAIRRISAGDLSFQFSPRTEDEFTGLEREFEGMTSNLRNLERELQIRSRMAAVGEMVAGVAHQIRNPLAVMKVSAEMIRDAAKYMAQRAAAAPSLAASRRGEGKAPEAEARAPDANIGPLAEMIASEVDTLNTVISKFLDFTRPLSVKLQEVEVGEFLSRAAAHIPMEKFPGRDVRVDVAEGAERAMFDRSLMEQAVSNLVANALAASRPGQEVLLRAYRSGASFRIVVEDEGEGMSEEVRSQLFHPFFTTKSDGTGLGLSIVHRIVEEHGGTIEVRTGEGGTSFEIALEGAA